MKGEIHSSMANKEDTIKDEANLEENEEVDLAEDEEK